MAPELDAMARALLLACARETLAAWAERRGLPEPPDHPAARRPRGAFVTLRVAEQLRGCIGRVTADRPLGVVVRDVTVAAAADDPRFPPVAPNEVAGIRLEISALGEPTALGQADPAAIEVGRHGLILRHARGSGLLLPQVAVEAGMDAAEFLAAVCRKAGLPPGAWRDRSVQLLVFEAEVFGE